MTKEAIIDNMSNRKKFRDRLSDLMGNNITYRELAVILGYSEKSCNIISRWMDCSSTPKFQEIIKLSEYFNVSTDYLLGLSDVKTSDAETKAICEKTHLSENAVEGLQNRNGEAVLFELIELLATSKEEDTVSKFLQAIKDRYAFYAQKENSAIAQEFYKLSELHISRYAFDLANEIVDSLVKKPSTKA